MQKLIVFAIVGFFAQLIDGALGMAYGITSTSLLLAFSVNPAAASASVHLAELVTTAASGVSHIKFKNVDKQIVFRIMIPGAVGAFLGATFLSNLPGDIIKPYVSLFLILLGIYILIRFLFIYQKTEEQKNVQLSYKQSIPLGFIGGFFDATGGGGWGPITTPILLSKKGMSARKAVGTVDTSEFVIALAASLGFFFSLGSALIDWTWVIALMIGGVFAAPLAAWLVRVVPTQIMGSLVGGFIILTNARTIFSTWITNDSIHPVLYGLISITWIFAVGFSIYKHNQDKKAAEKELPIDVKMKMQ